MKVFIHNNASMPHRVLVSKDSVNVAAWPIDLSISDAIEKAAGELDGNVTVPLQLFGGDALFLGTAVDGDVDLAAQVMLVKYQGSHYCVICGPEMRKLSAFERHLMETIGTTAVEVLPVADANIHTVLRTYHELYRAAARVTVVMDDGVVTHVEAVGVPRRGRVKIYNVVHQDDRQHHQKEELGRLVLQKGLVLDHVQEVHADLVHIDLPVDGAVYFAN